MCTSQESTQQPSYHVKAAISAPPPTSSSGHTGVPFPQPPPHPIVPSSDSVDESYEPRWPQQESVVSNATGKGNEESMREWAETQAAHNEREERRHSGQGTSRSVAGDASSLGEAFDEVDDPPSQPGSVNGDGQVSSPDDDPPSTSHPRTPPHDVPQSTSPVKPVTAFAPPPPSSKKVATTSSRKMTPIRAGPSRLTPTPVRTRGQPRQSRPPSPDSFAGIALKEAPLKIMDRLLSASAEGKMQEGRGGVWDDDEESAGQDVEGDGDGQDAGEDDGQDAGDGNLEKEAAHRGGAANGEGEAYDGGEGAVNGGTAQSGLHGGDAPQDISPEQDLPEYQSAPALPAEESGSESHPSRAQRPTRFSLLASDRPSSPERPPSDLFPSQSNSIDWSQDPSQSQSAFQFAATQAISNGYPVATYSSQRSAHGVIQNSDNNLQPASDQHPISTSESPGLPRETASDTSAITSVPANRRLGPTDPTQDRRNRPRDVSSNVNGSASHAHSAMPAGAETYTDQSLPVGTSGGQIAVIAPPSEPMSATTSAQTTLPEHRRLRPTIPGQERTRPQRVPVEPARRREAGHVPQASPSEPEATFKDGPPGQATFTDDLTDATQRRSHPSAARRSSVELSDADLAELHSAPVSVQPSSSSAPQPSAVDPIPSLQIQHPSSAPSSPSGRNAARLSSPMAARPPLSGVILGTPVTPPARGTQKQSELQPTSIIDNTLPTAPIGPVRITPIKQYGKGRKAVKRKRIEVESDDNSEGTGHPVNREKQANREDSDSCSSPEPDPTDESFRPSKKGKGKQKVVAKPMLPLAPKRPRRSAAAANKHAPPPPVHPIPATSVAAATPTRASASVHADGVEDESSPEPSNPDDSTFKSPKQKGKGKGKAGLPAARRRRITSADVQGEDEDPLGMDIDPTSPLTDIGPSQSQPGERSPHRVRVLACWHGTRGYYPATVTSLHGNRYQVEYDDGDGGRVSIDQLRQCFLQPGDLVKVDSGAEPGEYAVAEPWHGEGVVTITLESGKLGEVPSRGFHVRGAIIKRDFDDRRLSSSDLPPASGSSDQARTGSVSTRRRSNSITLPETSDTFKGLTFIVTSSSTQRPTDDLEQRIKAHGGEVFERWDAPFDLLLGSDFESRLRPGKTPLLLVRGEPNLTPKLITALAKGVPCLWEKFVDAKIADPTVDWRSYLIALRSNILGGPCSQMVDPGWGQLGWLPEMAVALRQPFKDKHFLFVPPKSDSETIKIRARLLPVCIHALGATTFRKIENPKRADIAAADYIFVEHSKQHKHVPAGVHGSAKLCNMAWLKQCVIMGAALPPEIMGD